MAMTGMMGENTLYATICPNINEATNEQVKCIWAWGFLVSFWVKKTKTKYKIRKKQREKKQKHELLVGREREKREIKEKERKIKRPKVDKRKK